MKSAKSKAKQPVIQESAGDVIQRNYWIQVGLLPEEVNLLKRIGLECGVRRSPCAVATRWFLLYALTRAEEVRGKMRQFMEAHAGNMASELSSRCASEIKQFFIELDSRGGEPLDRAEPARADDKPAAKPRDGLFLLNNDLYKEGRAWDANQRRQAAANYERWAKELRASADLMDPRSFFTGAGSN